MKKEKDCVEIIGGVECKERETCILCDLASNTFSLQSLSPDTANKMINLIRFHPSCPESNTLLEMYIGQRAIFQHQESSRLEETLVLPSAATRDK